MIKCLFHCLLFVALATRLSAQSWIEKPDSLINAAIDSTGELTIWASKSSSKNDFDFLVGNWKLKNKRLKERLNKCKEWIEYESTVSNQPLLQGIGNLDVYRTNYTGKLYEGIALRLFNEKTKLWSIYWTDANSGALDPPMVGSFHNNIGTFYAKDTFKGQPILVLFRWDKTIPLQPVWSQAFSTDNGKTWEFNMTNTSYKQ